MRYVYLAGPIMGCDEAEANDWRKDFDELLADSNVLHIRGISPLRCEPLIGEIYGVSYEDPKFGTARAIANKNWYDVNACDATLIYMPTPPEGREQSWGTIIEAAWAKALGKMVILVSTDPKVLAHPVLDVCCGWKLSTFEEAVEVFVGVLGGYELGGKNV